MAADGSMVAVVLLEDAASHVKQGLGAAEESRPLVADASFDKRVLYGYSCRYENIEEESLVLRD